MFAMVYDGPGRPHRRDVPDPRILDSTDAVVRVGTATICGTDLHILQGDVPEVERGRILGHEAVGTVAAIGSAVRTLRVGDRVLVSCISAWGACAYCREARYGQCTGRRMAARPRNRRHPCGIGARAVRRHVDPSDSARHQRRTNAHAGRYPAHQLRSRGSQRQGAAGRYRGHRGRGTDRDGRGDDRAALQPEPHRRHRPRRHPVGSRVRTRCRSGAQQPPRRCAWPARRAHRWPGCRCDVGGGRCSRRQDRHDHRPAWARIPVLGSNSPMSFLPRACQ